MLEDDIDRDSYEPVYVQMVKILKKAIAGGVFRPGEKLPSESQLCERFDVSPMTVRRVLNILDEQGIVSGVQGKGTFVNKIQISSASFELGELEEIFESGESEIRLLDTGIIEAGKERAEKLGIEEEEPVVSLERLICRSGDPLIYHREYLIYDPARPLVESELEVTSLRGLFTGSGTSEVKDGRLELRAVNLEDEVAKKLQCETGLASFRLEHLLYDFEDSPVSWGKFYMPGDEISFRTAMGVKEMLAGEEGKLDEAK